MRVIEPQQFKHHKKRKRSWIKPLASVVVLVLVSGGYFLYQNPPQLNKRSANVAPAVQSVQDYTSSLDAAHPSVLKTFGGNDFKKLFQSLAYPNTELFGEPPEITGDLQADARIRKLAEARGYRLTSIPVMSIVRTNEASLGQDDLLQPLAYEAWLKLKEAAARDGVTMTIFSGYRSPESQRELFLERLYAKGITVQQIASGRVDDIVNQTLLMTAVPGYSRHHSGYTVDFRCEDGSGTFGASNCFAWLNADNYRNAKEHGWIPSYPEEAEEQGPEPEPWEYLWVGPEAVSGQ